MNNSSIVARKNTRRAWSACVVLALMLSCASCTSQKSTATNSGANPTGSTGSGSSPASGPAEPERVVGSADGPAQLKVMKGDTNGGVRASFSPVADPAGSQRPMNPGEVVTGSGGSADGDSADGQTGALPSGVRMASTAVPVWALPLSKTVDIKVSRPAPGARVVFPVDVADLPSSGGHRATARNVFVAVYEASVRAWRPLPTRYDAATRTVSATAPHFSFYKTWVVDPGTRIWTSTVSGVQALTSATTAAFTAAVSGAGNWLRAEFTHPQKTITCGPTGGWVVKEDADGFKACVTVQNGTASLRMEDHFLFPYTAYLGFTPELEDIDGSHVENAGDALAAYTALVSKSLLIPGRGTGAVYLPDALAKSRDVPIEVGPDMGAAGMDFALALLSWIPETKEVTVALASREIRQVAIQASREGVSVSVMIHRVEVAVRAKMNVKKGTALAPAEVFFDAWTCVNSTHYALSGSLDDPEELLDRSLSTAKGCVTSALKAAEGEVKEARAFAVGVLAAIPDTYSALRAQGEASFEVGKTLGGVLTMHLIPPVDTGADSSGHAVTFITRVDTTNTLITYNVIQYLTGAAATRACKEDGVEILPMEWCNEYYYRDTNPLLRTAAFVPAGVKIYGDQGIDPKPVSISTFKAFVDKYSGIEMPTFYRLHFTQNGTVDSVQEMYRP